MEQLTKRPSRTDAYLIMAEVLSKLTTCRTGVGAVLVDENGYVIATGYNGAPSGMPHCTDVGCLMVDNHCQRAVHAEINAVGQAAQRGASTRGSTMYIFNHKYQYPCRECCKAMAAAGVAVAVTFSEDHGTTTQCIPRAWIEREGV